jgi:competence ComEA-like helix-hairpin-helix protein
LAVLLGICLTLVVQSLWQKWGVSGQPTVIHSTPGLDLNSATAGELAQVPGLGPKRAQRIMDHRAAKGPYVAPDEVKQVKGIGSRTADRVRRHIQTEPTNSPPADKGAVPSTTPSKKNGPTSPLDLNRATSIDLQQIPGIGPVLAQRIVEHRTAHGPFQSVKELTRVKGIKERMLEKIEPHVFVTTEAAARE